MRFDINETLLRHIATGGGAAFTLREAAAKDLTQLIGELFNARSDVRRLHRAQEVARRILHINDFGDIMRLREIVAQQELRGLIAYEKQKDHTAHTVYLYLLGIWFFDHVPDVRLAVKKKGELKTDEEACKYFRYQWLFASLLHDIGYAFYDLSNETVKDRASIDKIYSWEWLEYLFGSQPRSGRQLSQNTLDKLRNVHEHFERTYSNGMPAGTSKYGLGAQDAVIRRLAAAPWLGELYSDWTGKDIFEVLAKDDQGDQLRAYAKAVATDGYVNGKGQCVDHAVASGLLLFQYTSYWYWLMNQLRSDKAAFDEVSGGFDYQLDLVSTWVVDACRAAAYHNVQATVRGGSAILKHVTLEKEPVLYLAILCDELQSWDRYPAGDKLLREFEKYSAKSLEGGDIELTCSGTDTRKATFRIKHDQQTLIVNDMNEILNNRLPEFAKVVSIEEYSKSMQ